MSNTTSDYILAPVTVEERTNLESDQQNYNVVLYKGDIPASLQNHFREKYIYPVYIPELNVFGKLFVGPPVFPNCSAFIVMGICDSVEGPVKKATKSDRKRFEDHYLLFDGPFIRYDDTPDIEETYIPTMEELEEVVADTLPLTELVSRISNPPKNKVLAKLEKNIAILTATTKLKLLGDLATRQEVFISKWVSEDYISDEPDREEIQKEETVFTELPVFKYSNYSNVSGVLLPDEELKSKIMLALTVKEKKEVKSINDRIREIVVRTPQPMIKPPTKVSVEEAEAWTQLDIITKRSLLNTISLSPAHAHLILPEVLPEDGDMVKRIPIEYTKALSTLGKMMFYCLKRLRFGELCKEKTLETASIEENVTDELKKRWQPVTQEEHDELLSIISRMIIKVPRIYLSVQKTISFLNHFLPFWDIPGVNFTGSICLFLSLHDSSYNEDTARFYTPTKFDIKLSDLTAISSHGYYFNRYHVKIYPIALFFPTEGTIEYYSHHLDYKRDSYNRYGLSNFVTSSEILMPEGEIDCPYAHVVLELNGKFVNKLVKILPNTDCDIPVFQHEELDTIASKVYSRIKRNGTSLERLERASGSHCWNITMSPRIPEEYLHDPELCTQYINDYMGFYPVQLYRTREEHIWTHHVAMTRLYCKCVNGAPEFSVSPDQLNSVITGRTERYNYFAGKTTPLSILHKYEWRGFNAPHYIESKFDLQHQYEKENLAIPMGMVTTKFSNWLIS